jgi:hypothetical protein
MPENWIEHFRRFDALVQDAQAASTSSASPQNA